MLKLSPFDLLYQFCSNDYENITQKSCNKYNWLFFLFVITRCIICTIYINEGVINDRFPPILLIIGLHTAVFSAGTRCDPQLVLYEGISEIRELGKSICCYHIIQIL